MAFSEGGIGDEVGDRGYVVESGYVDRAGPRILLPSEAREQEKAMEIGVGPELVEQDAW